MLILAIEQSTSSSSIALLDDTDIVAEHAWDDNRVRNQHLFSVLPDLFNEASVKPGDVNMFAVGLGPGSFSGLRVSVSAVRALALPGKKPVVGVSSAEALAWDIFRERQSTPITIVGDARRGRFWFAQFNRMGESLSISAYFSLIKSDELPAKLKESSTIATPDWDRIGEKLKKSVRPGIILIEEKRVPRARTVGELAVMKISNKAPSDLSAIASSSSEPLMPIYLHPPVKLMHR